MKKSNFKNTFQAIIPRSLFASIFVIFAACGSPSDNSSQLLHDADQPVRNIEGFNWAKVSDSEYKTYMVPLLRLGTNFLESDHELSTRSQFWVDAIDSNLRQKHPGKMANVPKPTALIIANPSVNAFIAPIPVCADASVKLSATSGEEIESIYFDQGTGEFSSWPAQYKCRKEQVAANDTAVLKSMVNTFNSSSASGCKLELTTERGASTLKANSGCKSGEDISGVSRAKQIVFLRTASYVNIYTGLLSAMDTEEAFVGVIAHELGHFYRSHITADDEFYGYFYQMAEHNQDSRPTKGPASVQALGTKAVAASRVFGGGMKSYKKVPAQKLSSRVYLGVGSFAKELCKTDSCPAKCSALVTFMDSTEYQSATQMFPFRDLSVAGRAQYSEFEAKADACLTEVNVTSTGSKSWSGLVAKTASPTWPAWVVSRDYRDAVYELQSNGAALLAATAPARVVTVADAFAAMATMISTAEANAQSDLKTAFDSRLGQYTTEQEADDASAEWLAALNINPKFAGDTQMNLGKWAASKGRDKSMPHDLGYAECLQTRQNGWKSSDGAYQYIAIGDYDEVHHGFCYRAFNVDREIAAHGYRLDPNARPPQPGGSSWKRMQELAEQATSPETPERIGDNQALNAADADLSTVTLLRKLQSGACPMAPKLITK